MAQGRSVRWFSLVVLASGIAFGVACGGPSAPAAPPAPPRSDSPYPHAPAVPPHVLAAEGEPACEDGKVEHRFEPFECNPACTAHTTVIRRCVATRWEDERVEADCAPCPTALAPDLAGCELEHTTLKPSALSARDGCVVRLRCGDTAVQTQCDGENDDTNTSPLRMRTRRRARRPRAEGPVSG